MTTTFTLAAGLSAAGTPDEILEYEQGAIARRYLRLPGTIDEPFLMLDYTSGGAAVERWAHQNRLGSVVMVSDATGATVEEHTYDPYGDVGADLGGFPFRFTGQRLDPETGLYYYKSRYYDPKLGRFIETDPIGYEDQMNFYAYVGNDPLNATDPTGMCTGTPGGIASCFVMIKTALSSVQNYQQRALSDPVSEKRIQQLNPIVEDQFRSFVNNTETLTGAQLRIAEGYRTYSEQDALYAIGRGEGDTRSIVTNAQGGQSYHNFGLAIDVFVLNEDGTIDWAASSVPGGQNTIGALGRLHGLRWGGDFGDLPHFEQSLGLEVDELDEGHRLVQQAIEHIEWIDSLFGFGER